MIIHRRPHHPDEVGAQDKVFGYFIAVTCCNNHNEGTGHSEKDCLLKQDMCDIGHPGVLITETKVYRPRSKPSSVYLPLLGIHSWNQLFSLISLDG
jgi:hypothetical protein